MANSQRTDPVHQLATRLYATHYTVIQLLERAPGHLHSDFDMLVAKIEISGGNVASQVDPLGITFPVVTDASGVVISYETGLMHGEEMIRSILAAQQTSI